MSTTARSDDTRVMLDALRHSAAGSRPKRARGRRRCRAPAVPREATFFLGNAGTAIRPLAAALAIVARRAARFELRGAPRMHERPIGDLVDALRGLGCGIDYLGQEGFPPLRVSAGDGGLALDAPIRVRGDVSSQFLSALLMALPLRAASADALIEVDGELISKPYVDITIAMLGRFGSEGRPRREPALQLPAGQDCDPRALRGRG